MPRLLEALSYSDKRNISGRPQSDTYPSFLLNACLFARCAIGMVVTTEKGSFLGDVPLDSAFLVLFSLTIVFDVTGSLHSRSGRGNWYRNNERGSFCFHPNSCFFSISFLFSC